MYPKFEFLVQLWPQCTPWGWPKSKNPISLQLSVENIITIRFIWAFFGYKWAMGPGSKIKRSQLKLEPLFQKPLIIFSDHFLTLDLFLSATSKWWNESIGFPNAEVFIKSSGKKFIKKIKYSRSSSDPENSQCGHQQPYNLFSVFVNIQTLPDNSGKPKSVYSKQKN